MTESETLEDMLEDDVIEMLLEEALDVMDDEVHAIELEVENEDKVDETVEDVENADDD